MSSAEPMRLAINTRRWDTGERSGVFTLVADAIRTLSDIEVVESDLPPRQCIAHDGEVLALLDEYDAWDSTIGEGDGAYARFIEAIDPPLIIKQQTRRGAPYERRTIAGGLLIPSHGADLPAGSIDRERTIDVIARMRVDEYLDDGDGMCEASWMRARGAIVEQARSLEGEGYVIRSGRVPSDRYLEELYHTKIGFNWQGFGRLTYRIVEYLRAGVVMITQPLGDRWPLRDDVVLEDGVTCHFCDRPDAFAREAILLLRDREMMRRIRRNALELWRERLTLPAMGEWYEEQIVGVISRQLLSLEHIHSWKPGTRH